MPRYDYDLFISFSSRARKHVTQFLKMHQSKANWKVFQGEFTNTNKDELIQAYLKSRVVFNIQPTSDLDENNIEGFTLQQTISEAIGGNSVICTFDQFKVEPGKHIIFYNVQSSLEHAKNIEQNEVESEKRERRLKIGLLDLDIQFKLLDRIIAFREKEAVTKACCDASNINMAEIKLETGEYCGLLNTQGQRNGFGDMCYFNKNKYSGEWKNDLRHGFGIYDYGNDVIYEGEWNENKKDGLASIRNSEQKYTYKGYMQNGFKSGKGVYWFKCRSSYAGDWLNDQKNGQGVLWTAANELYDGEWLLNKKHGKGVYFYADDEKYEGEWKDDFKHGFGIYWYENGERFEGEWVNGKKHGKGISFGADGEVYDCEYDNDKLVKIVNRRTGENAVDKQPGKKSDKGSKSSEKVMPKFMFRHNGQVIGGEKGYNSLDEMCQAMADRLNNNKK